MNTTLRQSWIQSMWVWMTEMFSFFAHIVSGLPQPSHADDDPAALRYAANKYYDGQID